MTETVLAYESRANTRARAGWLQRLDPPAKAWRVVAWFGVFAIFWGSALLPGGMFVLIAGMVLAPIGVVPIAIWELWIRPGMLLRGQAADDLPGRWWILGLFLLFTFGAMTGTTMWVVASLLRPVWVPAAEYYYGVRPASAGVPQLIAVGPYVLSNPTITPGGIRGTALGGGTVTITWDPMDGYSFNEDDGRNDGCRPARRWGWGW